MARRGRVPRPPDPLPRRTPSNETEETIVEALLASTALVVAEHGLEGLTTNRVAERAGVSVGSLYRYFPNKEALIHGLHDRHLAQLLAAVPRALAATADQPMRVVTRRLIDELADVLEAQPLVQQAFWLTRTAAGLHERIEGRLRRLVELSADVLVARRLAADPVEARRLAFVIVHAADGLANAMALHREAVDIRATGRILAEMVADYLEARGRT